MLVGVATILDTRIFQTGSILRTAVILVSFTKLSPNHSGRRTHEIDRITPHAVAGREHLQLFQG